MWYPGAGAETTLRGCESGSRVDKHANPVENHPAVWTSRAGHGLGPDVLVDESKAARRCRARTPGPVHHPSAGRHRASTRASTVATEPSTAPSRWAERAGPPSPHHYYGDDGM